jgi:hypothetical protein
MSYFQLKDIVVKIKKNRQCWGCGKIIVPGFEMRYTVGVNEGEFQYAYWCEICSEYMNKHNEIMKDGVFFSDFIGEEDYDTFKDDLLFSTRKVFVEKFISNDLF